MPLEPFALPFTEAIDFESIAASTDSLPREWRGMIARYLRTSAMLMPFMEYTTDQIGNKFGVPGGSAIVSDGVYFWRLDTADYVEVYGVALPDDFLEFGASRHWIPPVIDQETEAELDEEISAYYRRGPASRGE